jgi:hypothetical protein
MRGKMPHFNSLSEGDIYCRQTGGPVAFLRFNLGALDFLTDRLVLR